jgi:hypothetical protein
VFFGGVGKVMSYLSGSQEIELSVCQNFQAKNRVYSDCILKVRRFITTGRS